MQAETAPKKPVPKHRFKISAEHMTAKKCEDAIAALKLKRRIKFYLDPLFTGFYHITLTCTKVEANRLQKCVWDQNHGASCEIVRLE